LPNKFYPAVPIYIQSAILNFAFQERHVHVSDFRRHCQPISIDGEMAWNLL
jgi:hypothetical protein